MSTKRFLDQLITASFNGGILVAMLATVGLRTNLAANETGPAFESPERAAAALYTAVTKDDQEAMSQLLGPTAVSNDLAQDKADRERFVQKYSEMHRLVKRPDGATVLYIGAENWPFPVPLVSNAGKWQFDVDSGMREIRFRHVGANEMSAIETSRAIARGASGPPQQASHGYQFRMVRNQNGSVVAYPVEYGVTGVMTFAVTPKGAVYEKDLGPKTEDLAQAITQYRADRTWRVAAGIAAKHQ